MSDQGNSPPGTPQHMDKLESTAVPLSTGLNEDTGEFVHSSSAFYMASEQAHLNDNTTSATGAVPKVSQGEGTHAPVFVGHPLTAAAAAAAGAYISAGTQTYVGAVSSAGELAQLGELVPPRAPAFTTPLAHTSTFDFPAEFAQNRVIISAGSATGTQRNDSLCSHAGPATTLVNTSTHAYISTGAHISTGVHANTPTDLYAQKEVNASTGVFATFAGPTPLLSSTLISIAPAAATIYRVPTTYVQPEASMPASQQYISLSSLGMPGEPSLASYAPRISYFNTNPPTTSQYSRVAWSGAQSTVAQEPLVSNLNNSTPLHNNCNGRYVSSVTTHPSHINCLNVHSYPSGHIFNTSQNVPNMNTANNAANVGGFYCTSVPMSTNLINSSTTACSSNSFPIYCNSAPVFNVSGQHLNQFVPGLGFRPCAQREATNDNFSALYAARDYVSRQPPISASYVQPSAVPCGSQTFEWGRPSMGMQLPPQNSTAEINLSTSQIAARHVISKDLPPFSGQPEDWPLFITNYDQSTVRCGFTDQENLIRLQKCLRGPALEAVRGKLMMPATVPYAIETLRMLYGRPDVIHQTLQRKLRQEPAVRSEKLETLISFSLTVQNYRATIQAIGLADYLHDPMLLNELLNKLPCDLKLEWGRRCMAGSRVNIAVFDEWLFNLATCASQVTPLGQFSPIVREETKSFRNNPKERILVHEFAENDKSAATQELTCPKCFNEHRLDECNDFRRLMRQDRWRFVQENRLCLRCFRNHFVRRCSSKKQCGVDGCKMSHNPLLHESFQNRNPQSDDRHNSTILLHKKEHKKAFFRYVPVTLYGKIKSLSTYALIDEGAACTLIENDIAAELGLDGPSEELCLRWTADITQNELNSKCVTLNIASRELGAQKFCLKNVRTISSLVLPKQSLDSSTIMNRRHLRDLPIHPYNAVQARILIGLDNAKIGVPLEVREDDNDDLIASRCRIGWAVYGRESAGESNSESILHICDCNDGVRMDELMKEYFSLDAVGVAQTSKPLMSKADERAQQIMESTTKYFPNEKRWETGLLWKYNCINLPDSLPMARRRLQCLETKMSRNNNLKEYLISKIQEYEQRGYVRKLKKNEISSNGKSWYIPIFTVTNKNKNKTRLVWDAAAKVNDIALNSVLLKGPDLLKSLVGILIRFREKPIAICGDIREMFHQIRVIQEDQAAQQFLWRDGDIRREPDVYAMLVMTFGASCSPSLANYIKNRNADRFLADEPVAVNAIIENTFVDDWLQSVDTEDEMIELAVKVRRIHDEGGFEMRNWLSNSKRVLQALTGNSEQPDKRIEEPDAKFEKILGMWWLPSSDEFTFVQKFENNVFDESTFPTKRQLLRVVMTIFDPLGLLGFYVVYAKIILQNIWHSKVGWDEPIHNEEREEWWRWVRKLPLISNIRVPRCYTHISQSQNSQLHIFVDASKHAYAAVVYLRVVRNDEVHCSLVASKTRVAPLKSISIPRLELMGAVLGLRLAKFVASELSIQVSHRVFWTDSHDVLYWIKSDVRKFQQFVALRVGDILENSKVDEWHWVPSAANVADDGTKWSKIPEFSGKTRWFTGPEFLYLPEAGWPKTELVSATEAEIMHHEIKKAPVSSLNTISPKPQRFSKWEKLCRVQRLVLRYLRLSYKGPLRSAQVENLLNIKVLDDIEFVIMRNCQENVFGHEMESLKSGGQINCKSVIFKCSPYLDEFGLLRVKGRIDAIEGVATSVKRPIILPRNHPVTFLIADFFHRKFHHHHNEIVVNEMRQRFCISGLRALVQTASKNCQICRNRRAKPYAPEMSGLPPERLASFTRPFTYTGVDYFGPIEIVVGRRREKRWGVLFTCLTIRAIHIEIAPSLSTDSFLLILKQFISRRGVPIRIMSDNGTNFRGASRVLVSEIEKVSTDELERKHPEIDWSFIPPASPHMGGAWERMVRSVKSILMDILPDSGLREEILRAALADVENVINSRPLTYVPLESPESEALTPNHFLIGCSNGVRERSSEDSSGSTLRKNFRIASQLSDQFWRRWVREYLPCLTRRAKWFQKPLDPIAIDDVVIIADENNKRNTWQKGLVVDVCCAKDGQVRRAVVKTQSGLITRPIVKLAKLDVKRVTITQDA